MRHRYRVMLVLVVAMSIGLLVVLVVGPPGILAPPDANYDRATVTVFDGEGVELAQVQVRIADSPYTRFVGLSATDQLGDGEGMLFVHDSESEHCYTMRGMEYSLDMIFIDADRTITTIHHAKHPESRIEWPNTYCGTGSFVLEVPYLFTEREAIDVGDQIEITDSSSWSQPLLTHQLPTPQHPGECHHSNISHLLLDGHSVTFSHPLAR